MFTHILVTILFITVVVLLVTLYHVVGKACDERNKLLELAKEFDEFRVRSGERFKELGDKADALRRNEVQSVIKSERERLTV